MVIGWLLVPVAVFCGYRTGRWIEANAGRIDLQVKQMLTAWDDTLLHLGDA